MEDRNYEFYLIDNIKKCSDKIRNLESPEDRFMHLNIYDELVSALVNYRCIVFGDFEAPKF